MLVHSAVRSHFPPGQEPHAAHLPWLPRPPPPRRRCRPRPTRPVRGRRLPRPLRRPDAAHPDSTSGASPRRRGRRLAHVDLGRAARAAGRDVHHRHPLRDQVVQARHDLDRRVARHAARRRSRPRPSTSPPGATATTRPTSRSRTSPTARRGSPTTSTASRSTPSTAARRGCWCRTCTCGRARSGSAGSRFTRAGRAGLLGGRRLPQPRRPVAGAALLERLTVPRTPVVWRLARVREIVDETDGGGDDRARRRRTGPATSPGQHVDVRLTAEDGYQAQRSYSIASAPEDPRLALTVERIDDGEVSPYLAGELRAGDEFELRGPVGGHFTWRAQDGGPLLLVAGGSGLVPLMAMLRHRAAAGQRRRRAAAAVRARRGRTSSTATSWAARRRRGCTSRSRARSRPGWEGSARRVDADMLRDARARAPSSARASSCAGRPRSSRRAADLLVELGHEPARDPCRALRPDGELRWSAPGSTATRSPACSPRRSART